MVYVKRKRWSLFRGWDSFRWGYKNIWSKEKSWKRGVVKQSLYCFLIGLDHWSKIMLCPADSTRWSSFVDTPNLVSLTYLQIEWAALSPCRKINTYCYYTARHGRCHLHLHKHIRRFSGWFLDWLWWIAWEVWATLSTEWVKVLQGYKSPDHPLSTLRFSMYCWQNIWQLVWLFYWLQMLKRK